MKADVWSKEDFNDFMEYMNKNSEALKRRRMREKKHRDEEKKIREDRQKAFIIASKIRRGIKVSAEEEKLLMQVDVFLYMFAKMSQSKEKIEEKRDDDLTKNPKKEVSNIKMLASL